ncbi:MAG: metallopeptidase family protein [Paracoccaceae bacterium]
MTAPSTDDVLQLALRARDNLPDRFRGPAQAVLLRVEDFADEVILKDLEIADPFDLTGLYDGIPMTEKSVSDTPHQPDTIWLFRRPILDEWIARGNVTLQDLVAHVYIHELAHHLGWSDDDISVIDRWWE